MTGIFLLDAVLVMCLIVLTVWLYRLLNAIHIKTAIRFALWLPVYALTFAVASAAAIGMTWLVIYVPIDLYVWLERATGISTGWWALPYFGLILVVLGLIWLGYWWILGVWHIRRHVARIELNGARRLTTSDYIALNSYIAERLKVGEVPTGSFSLRDEHDASDEHAPVAVFKNQPR